MFLDPAANAGVVIGAHRVASQSTDLPWCGAVLRHNEADCDPLGRRRFWFV